MSRKKKRKGWKQRGTRLAPTPPPADAYSADCASSNKFSMYRKLEDTSIISPEKRKFFGRRK